MIFDNKTEKTVLDIRLVMKNFIKKYEYDVMSYAPDFDDDLAAPVIAHYYAMSDWLRDVKAGDGYIGGNLHGIARSYVPGTTGTITANVSNPGYIIAIPAGAEISNYYIDLDGADSLRDRYVSDICEQPVAPTAPAASMNAYMDYWLKYEEYRIKWDAFTGCYGGDGTEMDTFTSEWNDYDGTIEDDDVTEDGWARRFTIPPYAVYADASGDFTIEDVAPGDYNVYYIPFANTAANYGRLIEKTDYDSIATPMGRIGLNPTITIIDSTSNVTIEDWVAGP